MGGAGKVEVLKEQHREEIVLRETTTEVQPLKKQMLLYRSVSEDRFWACYGIVEKITSRDFMLFSDLHQWSAGDVRYERGDWLRVYGTPVHAWNNNFFKLCVKDCGRFIHVDECTFDKGD